MTKVIFKKLIDQIQVIDKYNHKYYEFGIDLFEGKFPIMEEVGTLADLLWKSHYNEQGQDWISWFIYENECGKAGLEAFDGDRLICQTVEELYDYVEQYRIR